MTENALNKKLWLLTPREKEALVSLMEETEKIGTDENGIPSLDLVNQIGGLRRKAIDIDTYYLHEREIDKFRVKSEVLEIAATCLRIIKRLD